jgi:hypothetical protein
MTTTQNLITAYRKATDSLRKLTINPAPTSRPDYRTKTIAYNEARAQQVMGWLIESNPEVAGLATEEKMLLDRLAVSRCEGTKRPELRSRVRTIRTLIEEAK